jgi:hypothetical protein
MTTFTSIREGFEKTTGYIAEEAANVGQHIVQLSQSAYSRAAPYLQSALDKIQSINVTELLKSNVAKSMGLLVVAAVCATISREIDHPLGKGIFIVACIAAVVFAGVFLFNPALLQPIASLV